MAITDDFIDLSPAEGAPFVETFYTDDEWGSFEYDTGNDVFVGETLSSADSLAPLTLHIFQALDDGFIAEDEALQFLVCIHLVDEAVGAQDADPVYRYWVPSGLPQSDFIEISAGRETMFVESLGVFDEWARGYMFAGMQVFVLLGGTWIAGAELKLKVSGDWKQISAILILGGGNWKE